MESLTNLEKSLLDNYTCVICQEYAVDIQTSNCSCSTVFCKECSKPVRNCPICTSFLSLSPISFRIQNILREISVYKKHEEKIELEKKLKIPTKEEIEAVWNRSTYIERHGDKLSLENLKNFEEASRRLVWAIINSWKSPDLYANVEQLRTKFPIAFPWCPIIVATIEPEKYEGTISGNMHFVARYRILAPPISNVKTQGFKLIFPSSEIEKVPHNIAELFFKNLN